MCIAILIQSLFSFVPFPFNYSLANFMNRIIVTGGAGFIGSAVTRHIIIDTPDAVCVVDKLTYAGNLENLAPIAKSDRFKFEKVDICDKDELDRVFAEFKPTHVMHLAAESHVDRSIDGPGEFIQTNIVGTYTLLEAARKYYHGLDDEAKAKFKFHHISTDEVYGDLNGPEDFFRETTPYAPSSPYSASKASSDHLVRAWKRTFGLPTVVTNCSNNYGPYHFPEKLIPLVILHALDGKELPVYGEGLQIRRFHPQTLQGAEGGVLFLTDDSQEKMVRADAVTAGSHGLFAGIFDDEVKVLRNL